MAELKVSPEIASAIEEIVRHERERKEQLREYEGAFRKVAAEQSYRRKRFGMQGSETQ